MQEVLERGKARSFWLVVFIFVLVACSKGTDQVTPTEEPEQQSASVTKVPTVMPAVTLTPAATAIAEIAASSTPEPTATTTPIDPPTETPIPPTIAPAIIPAEEEEPEEDAESLRRLALLSIRTDEFREDSNRDELYSQVKVIQSYIREMAFELNESRFDRKIDCKIFTGGYMGVANQSPRFGVVEELELPNYFYNRSAERAIIEMASIVDACGTLREEQNRNQLAVGNFEPLEHSRLVVKVNEIMIDINEAILWINGDVGKTLLLYDGTKSNIVSYSLLLDGEVAENCEQIFDLFRVLAKPQKMTPLPALQPSYAKYLQAAEAVSIGGEPLHDACRGYLPEEHPFYPGEGLAQPISASQLSSARSAASVALARIIEAIRLMPVPTIPPTQVPVEMRLSTMYKSQQVGFYELVIRVIVRDGTPILNGTVGGFPIDPTGKVVIVHSCWSDFHDHAELTLLDGRNIQSAKVGIPRGDVCQ